MGSAIQLSNPSRDLMNYLEEILTSGLKKLIAEGCRKGNWDDVRGTSDAIMVLGTCLPPDAFEKLKLSAADWLVQRSIKLTTDDSLNWEEEVWDTSVAVMGLCATAECHKNSPYLVDAKRWLTTIHSRQNNWNDEPWESLWALLALYSIQNLTQSKFDENMKVVFSWLLSLCGKPKEDMLVNWHYTALFVMAAKRYLDHPDSKSDKNLHSELKKTRDAMLSAIQRQLHLSFNTDTTEQKPWTGELWSNSLALRCLAEEVTLEDVPFKVEDTDLQQLLKYFGAAMVDSDVQTEDLAFACLALFQLYVRLEKRCAKILEPLQLENMETFSEDKLRLKLKNRLSQMRDYCKKPDTFSANEFEGYYTINLDQKKTLLVITFVLTIALTSFSQFMPERIRPWFAFILLILGTLAIVIQLLGVDLKTLLRDDQHSN